MTAILNISAYKFVTLHDAHDLRDELDRRATTLKLKGTVLLAPEGINLFLAGPADQVNTWVNELRADPRFSDLRPKESWSGTPPFKKLRVKVKPEIIRMNHPAIRPDALGEAGRAPGVSPVTLKQWLTQGHDDEGRPVVTLDTRNAFEVDYGTFEGAVDWRIEKFSDFPDQLRQHAQEFEGQTVVSFCTGGIRCEKAALLMSEVGMSHVYQLDGGILKYLEDTDGAHWEGRCFVFDEREALGPALTPTGSSMRAQQARAPSAAASGLPAGTDSSKATKPS